MNRLLLICGMAALLVTPAATAKGSITLDTPSPVWGSTISFTFTTSKSPYVLVTCGSDQGRNGEAAGSLLYQSAAYPGTSTQASFTLPLVAQVGYCTGKLFDRGNGTQAHLLAQVSFTVSP